MFPLFGPIKSRSHQQDCSSLKQLLKGDAIVDHVPSSPSSVWEFCRTESLLTQQRERSISETSTQSQLLDESVYSKSFLFNPETLHWRIDTNVGALALVSSATCLSVSFLSSEFGGRGWYSLLTSVIETYYFLFPVVKNPALCRNHWKMTGWQDKGEVSVALATLYCQCLTGQSRS